jgi:uroporphyrinogen decarboxylase
MMDKENARADTGTKTGDHHVAGSSFLSVLAGQRNVPPPIWLMRQAGRYLPEYGDVRRQAGDFLTMCHTPDLAAEVTLQPIRRFGLDAAIVFSDILVVPQAFGQPLEFREDVGPVLEPVRSVDSVRSMVRRLDTGVLESTAKTLRLVRPALPDSVALIGFAGAPWTVAAYMVEGRGSRDFAAAKKWAYASPETFSVLIDALVDATAAYLVEQIKAGADAVQIFDSWAGLLPEDGFEKWCVAPARRIVEQVRAACPGARIIGFPRGAGAMYATYARSTGVDAVGLDTSVPLRWARDHVQATCAVQGNLDPVCLLAGGSALAEGVRRIIDTLGTGPLIFNLGHGVMRETPPEHVAELVSLVRAAH